ncbi:MAG: lysostaphin resistance A-like protein [Clostridium sp.]
MKIKTTPRIIYIGINFQIIVNSILLVTTLLLSKLGEIGVSDINRYNLFDIIWSITFPPIIEELLFRKLFYNKLKKRFSIKISAVISSIVFAIIHMNIFLIIASFIMGMISCKIYDKTKNIVYCIVFHATCNLVNIMIHNLVTPFAINNQNNPILYLIILLIIIIDIKIYLNDNKEWFKEKK